MNNEELKTTLNIEDIVNKLIIELNKLPNGTEISTSQLLGNFDNNNYSIHDLFEIQTMFIKKCNEQNIELDYSKYKDSFGGLPFNTPFIKKSKVEEINNASNSDKNVIDLDLKQVFEEQEKQMKINMKKKTVENEQLLNTLNIESSFYLSIYSYGVVPKFSPYYYNNRVVIRLSDSKELPNIVEIEKDKYEVYKMDIDFIKNFSKKLFDELITVAKQMVYNPMEALVGSTNELRLKIDGVLIIINLNYKTHSNEASVVFHDFMSKILYYFQSNDRLDYYKEIYKEKFNKDIVYNMANNEDIFKIINECVEKNIDIETYYSNNIKYDENVDY